MNVILLQKVHKLGNLGELVSVKPGFGRNFLIPQKKAVAATKENIAKFEARRAEIEAAAQKELQSSQQRATKLADLIVTIPANAGEEGRLFGSIGTSDLASAISDASGVKIVKSEIHLGSGPLRQLGEYEILVQLHADVQCKVKVNVILEANG